ncbi:GNAT family N-acetyltransferase [Tepidibacter formicigenes]|jgi:predicted GNAT family acetyltransferase|uniref:N-acetyltransferase domain-containing protein n=1 Tax=Tepidibacter formicigenes DSM 15518 TaxID=1123349 RepID=A0A1M6Q6J7_9FIRM|nr:GNAT family N-acetyltransferase [Tepidibacter formicigenes]SHK15904.1 hypothetical protein SAMN02744037_01760 [Tepidibacter formicigenes DSM 15518]
MIIELNNSHNDIVMKYLKKESEINLFIIGDIENYGYDEEFQTIWGEFNEKGDLKAVLLKYHNNLIFYSRDTFDINGFYEIMKNIEFKFLSGEKTIIEKFGNLFKFTRKRDMYFCKLDNDLNLEDINLYTKINKLCLNEVERIIELYEAIDEFDNQPIEVVKRSLESGRAYYIEEDNQIISIAQTTAENSTSAMIIGVCTHPNYRKKGYASVCMTHICKELLSENKTLCLFYNNPDAGKIYKRLGFKDVGLWTSYNK